MVEKSELTWETVSVSDRGGMDELSARLLRTAGERTKAAFDDLVRRGIMDHDGNLVNPELPPDMQPGAERDFGG